MLQTEIKNLENSIHCKLAGELKGMEAFELKAELKKYATKNKRLCLDLTGLTEISLTGFNVILMSKVYAKKQNNVVILILSEESKIVHHLKQTKMLDQFILSFVPQHTMAA